MQIDRLVALHPVLSYASSEVRPEVSSFSLHVKHSCDSCNLDSNETGLIVDSVAGSTFLTTRKSFKTHFGPVYRV